MRNFFSFLSVRQLVGIKYLLCLTISSFFLHMQIVAACDLAMQEDEQATLRAVKNATTK
jgi:hypothetical protein